MIWIVDNGKEYSDHVIAFVDVPDRHAELMQALVEAQNRGAHVIAKAPALEWFKGQSQTVAEYASDGDYYAYDDEAARARLQRVIDLWDPALGEIPWMIRQEVEP